MRLGDRRQPGAGGFDGVLLLPAQGVPAGVGLLDDVLSVDQRAEGAAPSEGT
jgi:hypothetical protein